LYFTSMHQENANAAAPYKESYRLYDVSTNA